MTCGETHRNAVRHITDQKVGGSSPSERTKFLALSSTDRAYSLGDALKVTGQR
jgi:hypothetical protein